MVRQKMIFSAKLVSFAILLLATYAHSAELDGEHDKNHENKSIYNNKNETSKSYLIKDQAHSHNKSQKFSSRIVGSKYAVNDHVFGIKTFPFGKPIVAGDNTKSKTKVLSSTEKVLDFRIAKTKSKKQKNKAKLEDDDEQNLDEDDMVKASAGAGKQKKEVEEEEEKTLAQQVADGKYGLIQNELFANGSKRPGILSYRSNNEVPKDTKENLGGLERDEIWLAEDHILVLRGGNYQNKENAKSSSSVWPPIDNYKAPNRQVKIPKNPGIPPPFPVQLSEDGPIHFVKGQNNPSFLPPIAPPLHPAFGSNSNKTIPLPFTVDPISSSLDNRNKSLPFQVPPHLLPPFLSNLPPGATFVVPPDNITNIDEDDPSIYYPPKYDFVYPIDNTTAVPPGPLVPGIILPPPPDFFSLLDNSTDSLAENHKETDNSINSVTPNSLIASKYLPALRKPNRARISGNTQVKRPTTTLSSNVTEATTTTESSEPEKPTVAYVYPENSKKKSTTTPSYQPLRKNVKAPFSKYPPGFNSPIFVPGNQTRSHYHYPLPTTSPKPNHITLPPTTKSLPKQILIITTPETTNKNQVETVYKKTKPVESQKYDSIKPEIHPLRSLIKPNVTISYNGKYGHLPPPSNIQQIKPEKEIKIIRGHYVTQPPLTKASKVPSTDVNSITVTPVPVVKKIRIQPVNPEKTETNVPPTNPSKATLYFYEESSTKETTPPNFISEKSKDPSALNPGVSTIKPEVKPVTPYYYTTHSTSSTPIRQYLEETFHSSNILSRKPQITQVQNAEIITHNGYSDIPKMKHLNYGAVSSPRPLVKYHYVTDGNPVIIPTPKIKDLEIKNSGTSGLQMVHLESVPAQQPPQPLLINQYASQPQKLDAHEQPPIPQVVTPNPLEFNTAQGPFIPSNYYTTIRPDHVHFTSQEQTLVDDITKNYFTIFGQKINSPSTTPLVPVVKPELTKTKPKQESGLTYISDGGLNFNIQQLHQTPGKKPSKSSSSFFTGEKAKTSSHPTSNFEKYLKELTGEDQRDYIVSGVFPVKIKKGKGFVVDGIPSHFISQHPILIKNNAVVTGPNIQYQPNLSTTLRPVANVEIKPQYIQQISPTAKPLDLYQHQIQPVNFHFNPALQQYYQEFTSLTSPTTKRPLKVKKPNLQYIPNSPSSTQYQTSDIRQKPLSLAEDISVNYKVPRPEIEPGAELINIPAPYDNIKIVDSPDLSRNPNLPYSGTKQISFDVGKVFFENIAKPQFYSPSNQNDGNSFVSYNLPGNGGHFYFLTPQIAEKGNEQENREQDKGFKRVNRSHGKQSQKFPVHETAEYSGQIEKNSNNEYSNRDYPRRRRKKP